MNTPFVIYLDQNAASYLAFPKPNSDWGIIRTLLINGFNNPQKKLICPFPIETLIESAPCDATMRGRIEQFFQSVSGGTYIKSHYEILLAFTIKLIRPNYLAAAFGIIKPGWSQRKRAAKTTVKRYRKEQEQMKARMDQYVLDSSALTMSPEDIRNSATLDRCGMVWRDLELFVGRKEDKEAEYEMQWLMTGLIKHGLTNSEAIELQKHIQHHRWESILVNFFDLVLASWWEHDFIKMQKVYKPNDEIDRWRASVALSHTDMLITDGYTAELCRRANTQLYSPTKVFSVKQSKEIIKALEEIA